MTKKRVAILLFLTLCLGGLLRLYKLGTSSLWFDEAAIFFHNKPLNNSLIWGFPLPSFYINFIHLLNKLNNSEFFLRLPSVSFALITILFLYFIAKQFFGKRQALLSAFLLAIAPFHIHYSQEVNKYTLLGLLGIFSLYFLYKYLENNKFLFWLGYTIFTILSYFTQYIFLLVLFSQLLFLISQFKKYNRKISKYLIIQTLLFLIILCLLPYLIILCLVPHYLIFAPLRSSGTLGINILLDVDKRLFFWSGPVNFKMLLTVFGYLYLGYNTNPLIFILGVMLLSYLFFRGVFSYRYSGAMLYLTSLTIIPILTAWIISHYKAIFAYRYLMVSALASYIIIACGILSFKKNLIRFLWIFLIILMAAHSLNNYYKAIFPSGISSQWGISARQDYRSLAKFLDNSFQSGDIICHNSFYTMPSLEYYLVGRPLPLDRFKIKEDLTTEVKQRRYLVFSKEDIVAVCLTNRRELVYLGFGKFSYLKGPPLGEINFKRMWLVSHCEEEEKENIDWVNNNFKKDREITFNNLKLFLYLNPKGT